MGGSGDLGECVQAPIARREAPVVCSALAPPGACSQAIVTKANEAFLVKMGPDVHSLALHKR